MKTVKHLPAFPSIPELMEAAYNEGHEGNILMSAELERVIAETYPDNDHAWQRINDAHCNGWADYHAEVEAA